MPIAALVAGAALVDDSMSMREKKRGEHGPACGAHEAQRLLDYWRRLDREAAQRLEAGRSVTETARELAGPEFSDWLTAERAPINTTYRPGAAGRPGPHEIIAALFGRALIARDVR